MTDFKTYTEFFENWAKNELSHTAEKQNFSLVGMDEILHKMRSDISFKNITLLLEYPETDLFENHSSEVFQVRKCGFWILKRVQKSNYKEIHETASETELIWKKLIENMLESRQNQCSEFRGIDINSIHANYTNPWIDVYGWRVEFEILTKWK